MTETAHTTHPPRVRHDQFVWFVALTYGWSWAWLVAAWLSGEPADSPPTVWFRYISGIGPLLAAGWLAHRRAGRIDVSQLWKRVVDVSSLTWGWTAALISLSAGPALVSWLLVGERQLGVDGAAPLIGVVVFALVASLAEEPGWRGYALDAIRDRRGLVGSTVLIGVVWAVWHLPLYAIEGTFQHDETGFGTTLFWLFSIALLPQTLLMIWVLDHTNASILPAVLFHGLVNVSGEVLELTTSAQIVRLLLWVAAALAVVGWIRRSPPMASTPQTASPQHLWNRSMDSTGKEIS